MALAPALPRGYCRGELMKRPLQSLSFCTVTTARCHKAGGQEDALAYLQKHLFVLDARYLPMCELCCGSRDERSLLTQINRMSKR